MSKKPIDINSDSEEEETHLLADIEFLNKECYNIKKIIRRKYVKLEKVRIRRAVKRKEKQIRRETRFLLPDLEEVAIQRDRLINGRLNDPAPLIKDNDDEDFPSVEDCFKNILNRKNDDIINDEL